MYLYHGTNKKFLSSILKYGLIKGRNNGDKYYIYLAKTKEEAKKWGNIILRINVDNLNLKYFPNENPIWQILCTDNIPNNKVKQII